MATVPEVDAPPIESDQADSVAVKALARVFQAWKVGSRDAANLAGVSERTWSRMKNGEWTGRLSSDQRMRASALIGLFKGLRLYFSDRVADLWPRAENSGPLFRGRSPVEFMVRGGLPAILESREYVDAVRGGV